MGALALWSPDSACQSPADKFAIRGDRFGHTVLHAWVSHSRCLQKSDPLTSPTLSRGLNEPHSNTPESPSTPFALWQIFRSALTPANTFSFSKIPHETDESDDKLEGQWKTLRWLIMSLRFVNRAF